MIKMKAQGEATEEEWHDYLSEEVERQKSVLQYHVEKVVIHPTTQHARRGFDVNRLRVHFKDGTTVTPKKLEASVEMAELD